MRLRAFFRAFRYAAAGIIHSIKTQRNMRFHLCAAVTVLALSAICGFDDTKWCIVLLCIASVIGAELINTAVEAAVDMHGDEVTPSAKAAKDCAAGAVLVLASGAALCGAILFFRAESISAAVYFFKENIFAVPVCVLWAAAAALFIFKKDK